MLNRKGYCAAVVVLERIAQTATEQDAQVLRDTLTTLAEYRWEVQRYIRMLEAERDVLNPDADFSEDSPQRIIERLNDAYL